MISFVPGIPIFCLSRTVRSGLGLGLGPLSTKPARQNFKPKVVNEISMSIEKVGIDDHLRREIRFPLRQHPGQSRRRYNQRAHKPPFELRTTENQPLADKMDKGQTEAPDCKVVHNGSRDIVGRVHPDDGRKEGPCAKGAGGQRAHERAAISGSGVVELCGVVV